MKRSSRRLLLPVLAALACALVVCGVLWWQLKQIHPLLAGPSQMEHTDDPTLPNAPATLIEDGDEALLYLRRGDLAGLQGDWAAAAEAYDASANAGGGLTALRKLAQAQLQRRDADGAENTLSRLRRAGARSEDLLLLESIILLRTGELANAKALLTNAADSPHKHYGLALLAIVQGAHDEAKAHLTQVQAGWEPVLRSYARTLQAAYDEYALFPESPDIHLSTLLSRALAQVQECELALPLLSQVTQRQNDYRDAWTVQGYCELMTERSKEALASFEHAYSLDPEKPDIQYFLARAYALQGDHGNALTFGQYAVENGFEPATEARRFVAREAATMGNATLALEQYEALTKLPDATIDLFAEHVQVALSLGKKEEAYLIAQETVKRWPQAAIAFDLLSRSALETNRLDEARTANDKALSLDPNLASAKERKKQL